MKVIVIGGGAAGLMAALFAARAGARVTLLGIQHKSIAFDADMTPEVRAAVDMLSDALRLIIYDANKKRVSC